MNEQVLPTTPGPPGDRPALTRETVLFAALLLVFAPAIAAMAQVWNRFDYLSHGYLVPLVSLWAFLRERPLRRDVPVAPDLRGALLVGVALLVYLGGLAGKVVSLQGIAFVTAVAGLTWLLRGPAWLRAVAFPASYLVFMVPPPSSWITPLIVELQVYVSSAAVFLLTGIGVEIARDGNILSLASGESMFVAEACSGVTSVITLTPLAVVMAAYSLRRALPRVVLVIGVIPLAMTGNLTRVLATVILADRYGVPWATEGPVHDLLGISTYVVACLGMLGLAALLRRASPARS